jgi:hypothetical protein
MQVTASCAFLKITPFNQANNSPFYTANMNIKKILLSIAFPLALASGSIQTAHAQVWPENYTKPGWVYQGLRGRTYLIPKVAADSASLPIYPLLWTNGTRRDSSRGALAYAIAEDKLYKWSGTAWSSVGGGSGTTITHTHTTLKYYTGYGTFGSFYDTARAAISLTTTGTSGAATYSSATGELNVPNYAGNGVTTMAAIGSSPNANGATISGSTLTLEPADSSFGGVITSGTQRFSGAKTFHNPPLTITTGAGGIASAGPRLYIRDNGVSDRMGIGVYSSEFQFFTNSGGTQRYAWRGGGAFQNDATSNIWMTLTSSQLTLGSGVTFSPGTLQPFKFPNTTSQAKLYWYDNGAATQRNGVGLNASEVQFFSQNSSRITWNGGGDLQSSGTNEWMRLTSAGLSLFKGSNPDASAALDIASNTKGYLPPRLTTTDRDAISSPATGLTLFCTDCTATDASTGVMQTYNGTTWKNHW